MTTGDASPEMTDQRVLVTGGAGFIGSHLVEALVGPNEVSVLDDFSTGSRANLPGSVTVHEGDVREEAVIERAMDGVDVVFHLAALVDVDRSVDDPRASHAINAAATLSLLERARRADTRVVFASSAAVYGSPDSTPTSETAAARPRSPYGLDKLTADHYCRLYHELYGLETVALRFFNVYGPRQSAGAYSGVIDVFMRQAMAGDPITVHGDGTQTRDFVHVDDVVEAVRRAAATDRTGTSFNVGTGSAVSILELAEHVREVTGSDSPVTHEAPRPGDIEHSCADVSRARSALGYEPSRSLAEGLETVRDWLQDADEPDG